MKSIATAVGRLAAGGAVTLNRAPEGYDAFVVAALARGLARAGETRGAALAFVARLRLAPAASLRDAEAT